jgi:hypothetical protein
MHNSVTFPLLGCVVDAKWGHELLVSDGCLLCSWSITCMWDATSQRKPFQRGFGHRQCLEAIVSGSMSDR